MNHCRGWTVFLVLTCVLIFLGSPGQSAQPDKGDIAAKEFVTLVAKLPIIAKNLVPTDGSGALIGKPKIEIARRISRDEAKITLVVQGKEDREVLHCFIFLRFFEGHWTTVRGDLGFYENAFADLQADAKRFLDKIMRAIDKASGE